MPTIYPCECIPLEGHQTSFRHHGREAFRWNFGGQYTRPFFHPVNGPSGSNLVRIGHPGAPNHDHHRGIWFAHTNVSGVNFWAEDGDGRIRQSEWLVYEDGEDSARMGVKLHWHDGHDATPLLTQDVITTFTPRKDGEYTITIQSKMMPTAQELELGQTNFGLLAVRVAKSLSEHFGGGTITNAALKQGEPAIFGKESEWMDYSGPVRGKSGPAYEGLTYIEHPDNISFPSKWHVREDGWMGASLCRDKGIVIGRDKPLVTRYLIYVHSEKPDIHSIRELQEELAQQPLFDVVKGTKKHTQYQIVESGP